MRIEGKTAVFKTEDRLFDLEKSGVKPYTVRILELGEYSRLLDTGIHRVRIEHAELPNNWFECDFVSATTLGKMLGRIFVGIAWNPKSCMDERFPEEK